MKRLESALVSKWVAVHRAAARRKADVRPPPPLPYFSLEQVHGIELNGFAAFLARVVMWIGEHLSARELGLDDDTLPLKALDHQIVKGDALFMDWCRPDGELAIVGNPPYLGGRKIRGELGEDYAEELFDKYPGDRAADLVTYWFRRALGVLRPGERAGFVCTNAVAKGESREASIDKIVASGGTITDAWKSYPWPGEAAVSIAIVNWIMSKWDGLRTLDGHETAVISTSLSDATYSSVASHIDSNESICFQGVILRNHEFIVTEDQRTEIISKDPASGGVIRSLLIGRDVNREIDQKPTRWVIDFGVMTKAEASQFSGAYKYVQRHVYPARMEHKDAADFKMWWQLWRPRPALRAATSGMKNVLVIPCVSPHLIVSIQPSEVCFDHQLMVVALDSHYHFGLLQSRTHETWAWARGSTHEARLRYTNTTIFETFPFPRAGAIYDPRAVPMGDAAQLLSDAAKTFDQRRHEACRAKGLGLTKIHNLLRDGELPALTAAYEGMNDAVDACYGFPAGTWRDQKETLRLLGELSQRIVEPVNVDRRSQA